MEKITKIDFGRIAILTKRVAKRMRGLRTPCSRRRNLLVCKFPVRMEKIGTVFNYSLVATAEFAGVKRR